MGGSSIFWVRGHYGEKMWGSEAVSGTPAQQSRVSAWALESLPHGGAAGFVSRRPATKVRLFIDLRAERFAQRRKWMT
ncbi:hypothetical protein EFR84_32300 [Rhizobium chutanense]|uniref:Uncharacterized protein n=1 Tax=Rhizobium chutanense TaxID=2035448 RepID=A0A432NAI6_9HYPH|nr:hypothetical protein EFR84_32300 [Rhizobium chutanense]